MNDRRPKIILAFIGIGVISLLMVVATYAWFSLNIIGEGKNTKIASFNKIMKMDFVDTSNIALSNIYTGEGISKTFTVENTGETTVFYNIVFTDLVNSFVNPNDLVYELISSTGGANKIQTVAPTENNTAIASHIRIGEGEKHEYTLNITFLKTDEDQSRNMNKTFSTKVIITEASNKSDLSSMYASNSLGYAILKNNTFLQESAIDYNISPTNGLYYTNNSIDGTTVYFFRGDNTLNNNVYFAGMCFKVIRTTEDMGIRLLYNGTSSNGKCESTGNDFVANSEYNTSSVYNAYVGFKYGSPNSGNYESEHTNTNSSNILTELNTWYNNNLSDHSSYITDSYYCNNRKTHSYTIDSILYTKNGYSNLNTGYDSYYRLNINSEVLPTLDCYNANDIFTVNNAHGNSSIGTNPVGVLTADEVVMAGITSKYTDTDNYIYSAFPYWTMTPAYFYANNAYNYYVSAGTLSTATVATKYNIRPVITLKQDTVLLSGDGSAASPYKITN